MDSSMEIKVITFLRMLLDFVRDQGKHKLPDLYIHFIEETVQTVQSLIHSNEALYENCQEYRRTIHQKSEALEIADASVKVKFAQLNSLQESYDQLYDRNLAMEGEFEMLKAANLELQKSYIALWNQNNLKKEV